MKTNFKVLSLCTLLVIFVIGIAIYKTVTPAVNQISNTSIEVPYDDVYTFSVPFILKKTTIVYFNGALLNPEQWSGIGTKKLGIKFPTGKYDHILIQNN